MKAAIKAWLAAVGLAPFSQVERLTIEVRHAADKIGQLEERLVQARADAEGWKRRYEDAAGGAAGWKAAAAAAGADLARGKAEHERARAELERVKADAAPGRAAAERDIVEWKTRCEKLAVEVQDLRTRLEGARGRLEETQHDAAAARDQLMSMEVKLDLIESAIQVLDARTREAAISHA